MSNRWSGEEAYEHLRQDLASCTCPYTCDRHGAPVRAETRRPYRLSQSHAMVGALADVRLSLGSTFVELEAEFADLQPVADLFP